MIRYFPTGHLFLSILATAFALAGCSRSNDTNHVASDLELQTPDLRLKSNHQEFQSSISNQQQLLVPQNRDNLAETSRLHLSEVRGDGFGYRYAAKSLIEGHPDVQEALKHAQPTVLDEGISSKDLEWISSELAGIKGFSPFHGRGTAVKYDRFIIVMVGGFIDDKYFNVYFIRIPGHGWMYLEKNEVPAPMGTFRH